MQVKYSYKRDDGLERSQLLRPLHYRVCAHSFNMGNAKARVLKNMSEKVPNNFRKFLAGTQFDRLLQTLILYFTAMFQLDWVIKMMEKSRKQHVEGAPLEMSGMRSIAMSMLESWCATYLSACACSGPWEV